MPSIDKNTLLASICPPLDQRLADQMTDEFISLERRYVLREWEPATLDGGQFAEASARLLYHQDSGILNRRKGVNECLTYVEDPTNSNPHAFPERKAALHINGSFVSFTSSVQIAAQYISDPDYTANHLDSKLVLENCRWVISEFLRVFWTADRRQVAVAIRRIVQYDIPVIGVYDGCPLVQRVDCSAEEEVLILLHHAGEEGMSRTDIGRAVPRGAHQL